MASAECTAMTFIVRMSRDSSGGVRGIVERAATGAKERFVGCAAIGPLIAGMIETERTAS
jgi:hypothetical protein